jgi:tRNA-specific 2-thiouridylase
MSKISAGDIVNESGEVVGEHSGYTDYTIGQRKGLGLSTPEPRYVSNIDPSNNQIKIGKKESLTKDNCKVSDVNWLVDNISFPFDIKAQIRYNSPTIDATITQSENGFSVQFLHPQIAVTPGQSIVFYKDDIVLGGGIIERNIEH